MSRKKVLFPGNFSFPRDTFCHLGAPQLKAFEWHCVWTVMGNWDLSILRQWLPCYPPHLGVGFGFAAIPQRRRSREGLGQTGLQMDLLSAGIRMQPAEFLPFLGTENGGTRNKTIWRSEKLNWSGLKGSKNRTKTCSFIPEQHDWMLWWLLMGPNCPISMC